VGFQPTALGVELGVHPYLLRETGTFTFKKQFQIVSFDLSIPYIDAAMVAAGFPESPANATFRNELIDGICNAAMGS
jgi:hypothetical protein